MSARPARPALGRVVGIAAATLGVAGGLVLAFAADLAALSLGSPAPAAPEARMRTALRVLERTSAFEAGGALALGVGLAVLAALGTRAVAARHGDRYAVSLVGRALVALAIVLTLGALAVAELFRGFAARPPH